MTTPASTPAEVSAPVRPPMRISVDETDPGYSTWVKLGSPYGRVRVLLDGRRVQHAVTADEGEGIVIVNRTDAAGQVVLDDAHEAVVRDTLRGDIRIEVDA